MSLLHPTDLLDRRFQIGRRDTAVAISSSTYNSPLVCFHAETPYLLPPTVIAAAIIVSLAIHTAPPCIFFPHLSICPVEPQYYKSCTFSAQLPPCPFLPSQPSLAPLASDNAFLQCQRSSVLVSAPIFSGSVCLQPGRKPHFVCLSHFGSLLSHPFFFFFGVRIGVRVSTGPRSLLHQVSIFYCCIKSYFNCALFTKHTCSSHYIARRPSYD